EIRRIGEDADADRERRDRHAEAGQAVAPDHHECADRERHRDGGDDERTADRGKRGNDFEKARAADDDREQRDHNREHREAARPDREPRGRILADAADEQRAPQRPAQIRFSAAHSGASSKGFVAADAVATALIAATRFSVSGWSSRSLKPGWFSPAMRRSTTPSARWSPPILP